MTRGWISVALACAFGALIGTLSALEISTRFAYGSYLWGIGGLLGGIVVYVAIDFRHFCAGVARSYRQTLVWRPHRLYWRAWFANWVGLCLMIATCLMFLGFMAIGISYFDAKGPMSFNGIMLVTYYGAVYFWPGMSLTVGLWMSFAPLGRSVYLKTDAEYNDMLRRARENGYEIAIRTNPFSAIFYMLYGIVWVAVRSPRLIGTVFAFIVPLPKLSGQFLARAFVYAHSQRRTICFVDASLGSAVGYTFGSAIVGAIAGALLGVISYELVSIRWLRLAPTR